MVLVIIEKKLKDVSSNDNHWIEEYKRIENQLLDLEKEDKRNRSYLYRIHDALKGAGCRDIQVIRFARVPILKFKTKEYMECDLCINNPLAVFNSKLLRAYTKIDSRVAILGTAGN